MRLKPSIIKHPLNWVKTATENNILLLLSVAFNRGLTYYEVIPIYNITQSVRSERSSWETNFINYTTWGIFLWKSHENKSYSAYINDFRMYFFKE